jgi:hypothetical protein
VECRTLLLDIVLQNHLNRSVGVEARLPAINFEGFNDFGNIGISNVAKTCSFEGLYICMETTT